MSIRKRKSKKAESGFTYQVYFSYVDSYTNEHKTYSKSGFLTYEDASLFEKKKKLEFDQKQTFIKQYKVTIDDVFQEWLEIEAKYLYQDNSIIDYMNRYHKHIKNRLGSILLYELDYKKLQLYFNENKDIGLSTNFKLKEILNVIINFAIKCNYLNQNPLKYIHIIGTDNNRNHLAKTYNEDDFTIIINKLLEYPSEIRKSYAIALYIGKYTGLRISEVFALEMSDFLFSSQQIIVNKKMVYANKKRNELYVCNHMKSKSSYAILPFHKELQDIMKEWFHIHSFDHVISDENGKYLNPKQLEYTLWKMSKELGVNFHFHMLRHTLASRLVNNGANLKAAQEILRHANISTTMNIYTHVNQELKTEALYKAFPLKDHN